MRQTAPRTHAEEGELEPSRVPMFSVPVAVFVESVLDDLFSIKETVHEAFESRKETVT